MIFDILLIFFGYIQTIRHWSHIVNKYKIEKLLSDGTTVLLLQATHYVADCILQIPMTIQRLTVSLSI